MLAEVQFHLVSLRWWFVTSHPLHVLLPRQLGYLHMTLLRKLRLWHYAIAVPARHVSWHVVMWPVKDMKPATVMRSRWRSPWISRSVRKARIEAGYWAWYMLGRGGDFPSWIFFDHKTARIGLYELWVNSIAILATSLWVNLLPWEEKTSPCTKIDAMVCAIQKIVAEHPKVQCLVFSQWTSTLRKLDDALRAQNLDPFLTGRRGKAASKKIILMTPDFLYSERPSQEKGQKFALESNTTIRHVFLTNTFLAPVKDAVLEQRIIDFAKTNQLGVASTVVLHRFVIRDTVPWPC